MTLGYDFSAVLPEKHTKPEWLQLDPENQTSFWKVLSPVEPFLVKWLYIITLNASVA